MSTDVRLGWQCEHVVLERLVVGAGVLELPLQGQVGSYSTIRVVAGEDQVPPGGLPSLVQVWSRAHEPYEGTLRVDSPLGSATLSAQRWDAATTAAALSRSLFPATGCLVVSSRGRIGVSGRERVRAQGLGMSGEALSIQGWPAWRVSEDGSTLVFLSSFPQPAVVQVQYSSRLGRCPRCLGGDVENDARPAPNPAEAVLAQEFDLLVQQSLKWLLTKRASNPVRPWYGSQLWDLVGAKNATGAAELEAGSEVSRVLSELQAAQRSQSRYQNLTDAERLNRIVSVRATIDPKTPTVLSVLAEVESASGRPVTLRAVYAAPGTASRAQGVGGLGYASRGLAP